MRLWCRRWKFDERQIDQLRLRLQVHVARKEDDDAARPISLQFKRRAEEPIIRHGWIEVVGEAREVRFDWATKDSHGVGHRHAVQEAAFLTQRLDRSARRARLVADQLMLALVLEAVEL